MKGLQMKVSFVQLICLPKSRVVLILYHQNVHWCNLHRWL